MKLRNHLIALLIILISANGFSQNIRSGKSSIHINTKKEVKVKDTQPPVITITDPLLTQGEVLSVKENELTILGQVKDESGIKTLFINAEPVTLTGGNIFAYKLPLKEGNNNIDIRVFDNEGNYTAANYMVEYKPEIVFRSLSKGKYYALLIGIDDYIDPTIDDLDNPLTDATKLMETLIANYTFEPENVKLLKNATEDEIILALDELAGRITPDDNLLLFYAGHGWWDEKSEIGYWLPADAVQANKIAWFRNSTLCDYLKEIDSKHTLLIADACFGGSIFNTRTAFSDASKAVNLLYELPSRKAMTSGTLTVVPDRSAFTRFLIERLSENQDKYLSSEQLFSSFRMAVINNSENVPQYGQIRNVGDQGGDFIFIKR